MRKGVYQLFRLNSNFQIGCIREANSWGGRFANHRYISTTTGTTTGKIDGYEKGVVVTNLLRLIRIWWPLTDLNRGPNDYES